MLASLLILACPLLLIVAAVSDAATMRIPNWISLALVAVFIIVAPFLMTVADLGLHVLVGMTALGVGFTLFAFNLVGGGDAKLLAAAAVWMGPPGISEFIVWTALAGGALGVLLLAARKTVALLPVGVGETGPLGWLISPKFGMPYGLALAAGGLKAFPETVAFASTIGAAA